MLYAALLLLLCYLIGSIPFPILVSRYAMGIDLRRHGSGNMGAMNAARVLGKRWFPVVFGLDFAKGLAAAGLMRALLPGLVGVDPLFAASLGALGVVVGHCFPVFAQFRGGVGLAASAGAMMAITPWLLVGGGGLTLVLWGLTRNMYVGVGLTAFVYPAIGWLVGLHQPALLAVLVAWGLVVFALHLADIRTWLAARADKGRL